METISRKPSFDLEQASPITLKSIYILLLTLICIAPALGLGYHPDEASRSLFAQSFIKHGEFIQDGHFSRYWPPLMLWIDCLAQMVSSNHLIQRLVFFLPFFPIISILATRAISLGRWHMAALLFVMPLAGLCVATRSTQGIQLVIMSYLLVAAYSMKQSATKTIVMAALLALGYLCNPSLILISALACAAMMFFDAKLGARLISVCILAYILCVPYVAWSLWSADIWVPTFADTGPMNLWLGNNPDPLSYRGVGDYGTISKSNPNFVGHVISWATTNPFEFSANIAKKILCYWSPVDYFRSRIFDKFGYLVFSYIAATQLIIYGFFIKLGSIKKNKAQLFALLISLAAWVVYSLFFTKVRFRIPFDMLLLMAVFLAPRTFQDSLAAKSARQNGSGATQVREA